MLWAKVHVRLLEHKEGDFYVGINEEVDPDDSTAVRAAAERAISKQRYRLGASDDLDSYMSSLPTIELLEFFNGDAEGPKLEQPLKLKSND